MAEVSVGIEFDAKMYKRGLEGVMSEAGLDIGGIALQGCICCDVGEGSEVVALSSYKPKLLIASEPKTSHYYRKEIDESLHQITKKTDIELIREDYPKALRICKEKGRKVGLITWLNIYPDFYDRYTFINFFKLAKPLLVKGGVVMVSVDWVDPLYWGGAGELVMAWKPVEALGYQADFVDREGGSVVGGVFLIGINK